MHDASQFQDHLMTQEENIIFNICWISAHHLPSLVRMCVQNKEIGGITRTDTDINEQ